MLRHLHDDPHAPDAMQTKGFLLEMFPVKQYKVEAIEYFHPVDKFHIYYRFLIRNATGKRVWQSTLRAMTSIKTRGPRHIPMTQRRANGSFN